MEVGLKELGIFTTIALGVQALTGGVMRLFTGSKIMKHQTGCRHELDEKISSMKEDITEIKSDVKWITRSLPGIPPNHKGTS